MSEVPQPKCDCRQCDSEGHGCGMVDLASYYFTAKGEYKNE